MPRPKDQIYLWICKKWCKRCGICSAVCPTKVFDVLPSGYPVIARMEKCVDCGLCSMLCPDYAIFNEKEDVIALGLKEEAKL